MTLLTTFEVGLKLWNWTNRAIKTSLIHRLMNSGNFPNGLAFSRQRLPTIAYLDHQRLLRFLCQEPLKIITGRVKNSSVVLKSILFPSSWKTSFFVLFVSISFHKYLHPIEENVLLFLQRFYVFLKFEIKF